MYRNQSLAHKYRETEIKTSNPLQLIVILYDAAICSLKEARGQMERKDIAGRSRSINKCISIISELQSCLDLKAGGDIASSLDRLYDYMKRSIFTANAQQTAEPLAEIENLLEKLRTAWDEVAVQSREPETRSGAHSVSPLGIIEGGDTIGMQLKPLNLSI
jgi:flagellar protein FliS